MATKKTNNIIALDPSAVALEQMENNRLKTHLQTDVEDAGLQAVNEIARAEGVGRRESMNLINEVQRTVHQDNGVNVNSFLGKEVLRKDFEDEGTLTPKVRQLISKSPEFKMEKLARTDLFPTIDQGIQQGVFQSKTFGSVPIFAAPGAVVPMEAINARQRALKAAALERRQNRSKIMAAAMAQGASQYQQQLDDMSMNMIEKWSEKSGHDLLNIRKDPKMWMEYINESLKVKNFASETVRLAGLSATILENAGSTDVTIPASSIKVATDFAAGSSNLQDYYDNPKKFSAISEGLQSYANMTAYVGEQKQHIESNIESMILSQLDDPKNAEAVSELFEKVADMEDYDLWAMALREFLPDERMMGVAEGIKGSLNLHESVEEVAAYTGSLFGDKITVDHVLANKLAARKQAWIRNQTNKPKKEVESLGSEIRGSVRAEGTGQVTQEFLTGYLSVKGGTDADVNNLLTQVTNQPGAMREDGLLLRKIPFNASNTKPQKLSGNTQNMEFEVEPGVWMGYESAEAALTHKFALINADLDNYSLEDYTQLVIDHGNLENVEDWEEFIKDIGGEKNLGKWDVLVKMKQGQNAFIGDYQAVNVEQGLSYYSPNGDLKVIHTDQMKGGSIGVNNVIPSTHVTYKPLEMIGRAFDFEDPDADIKSSGNENTDRRIKIGNEFVDYGVAVRVKNDMTTDAMHFFDEQFSKQNTQKRADERTKNTKGGGSSASTSNTSAITDI